MKDKELPSARTNSFQAEGDDGDKVSFTPKRFAISTSSYMA